MKIIEVIDKIRDFHGRIDNPRFDKVIWGDTDRECTGIVTCCTPSVNVIKKAHELGANLVISHEPAFFTSFDDMPLVEDIKLVQEKIALIDELGITIWRDHDHMHGGGPGGKPDFSKPDAPKVQRPREKTDYVFYGIMKILGWEDYVLDDIKKPLLYEIPETDVTSLAKFLAEKFNLNGVRIVGDTTAKVRKVFICEHVRGRDDEQLYKRDEITDPDVYIPLEIVDWSLTAYIRDAALLGKGKAILEMGHYNFEEPGMRYMAESWLPELLGGAIPVTFVQSGDYFSYVTR